MTRVLGIDGGGTRTRAVIVDDAGRLHAAAEGGSINLDDHPRERVEAELRSLLGRLASEAGRDGPWDAAFLAVGGALTDEDRGAVRSVAAAAGAAAAEAIGVHHDAYGALAGGLAGEAGMLVVAGTGSICFGRAADGREARCGNWGPLLGDEGSGHWLGREALRAVVRAQDGREPATALTSVALAWLGLGHPDELLRRMHVDGPSRAEIAAFAPELLRIAREGDRVARNVLARGCHELAQCVRIVCDGLFDPSERMGRPVPTVLVGGLMADHTYRNALEGALRRVAPRAEPVEPKLPAVLGAARLALQRCGAAVDDGVDEELAKSGRVLPPGF